MEEYSSFGEMAKILQLGFPRVVVVEPDFQEYRRIWLGRAVPSDTLVALERTKSVRV